MSCHSAYHTLKKEPEAYIKGYVAEGFEEVKDVFIENFRKRHEKGAALTVYYKDTIVVNLCGGFKNKMKEPFDENTLILIFSATKGITALTTAMAISDGLFTYEDKIAEYWQGFETNGKENITVNQMLSHQAGVPLFDKKIRIKDINDTVYIRTIIEKQKPLWKPGTKQGYHLYSSGLYINELFKHCHSPYHDMYDYFSKRIAEPLHIEFYYGLPDTVEISRVAQIQQITSVKSFFKFWQLPPKIRKKLYNPFSLLNKTFRILIGFNPNRPSFLKTKLPSVNGIGKVKDIARLYWIFAQGAPDLSFDDNVFEALKSPGLIMPDGNKDVVLGIPMFYNHGFRKPSPSFSFGLSENAFGMTGAGGSFAFADPDLKIGYCYAPTLMKGFAQNDPREKALRECLYRCIEKLENK